MGFWNWSYHACMGSFANREQLNATASDSRPQKSVKIAWSGVAGFFCHTTYTYTVLPLVLKSKITGIVMQEGFYAIMTEATE